LKELETENSALKEKIKLSENDTTTTDKNELETKQVKKVYEQRIKELETKLTESVNLNSGLEKKISIYSKEMESRFKKLIQDSEKKEIENKELLKKTEILSNKMQEYEKNSISSNSLNSKYDILIKENTELKNEKRSLNEALENMEEKIVNLETRLQGLNEKGDKGNYDGLEADYETLQEKYKVMVKSKNKLENEYSQIKVFNFLRKIIFALKGQLCEI